MEENKQTTATQESETVEKKEKVKEEFNVDKLSEKECKKLLKSLIKENEEVNASLEKAEEGQKATRKVGIERQPILKTLKSAIKTLELTLIATVKLTL